MYIAHINEYSGNIQTVREHSENTAELCRFYAEPMWKEFMYAMGLAHDLGKLQPSFQRRIRGEKIRVEHSTCGALALKEKYSYPVWLMMSYCITGHHAGIPNGKEGNDTADMSTLSGRLLRKMEDFSAYKTELSFPEIREREWQEYLTKDCEPDGKQLIDKFAFFTRYAFSCLVDADSTDTAEFCREKEMLRKIYGNFSGCLKRVKERLASFQCETDLQKTRSLLQEQAFKNAEKDAEIYLLNMPTGSGKTLASVKIALERVIKGKKKRIIYVIPYNSIIEQTAGVFEKLFQEDMEILRHQSTFSYEDAENSEDYREAFKSAAENWDAPFVITTAVQFFESLHSNKRGKLRKLHNMADSILVFDEAHLMPEDYLQPCLQAIAYLTKYLNSEAIFLTATMPDFEKLLREYALKSSRIRNLICGTALFEKFRKCRYVNIGELESMALLQKAECVPSALIVVNNKKTARKLYRLCRGKKYHLSTYMTPLDRKRILTEIRNEVRRMEEDFPEWAEVPEDRRITIISTSLIEAGVDLDVHTVFREAAGLDSILQAGGRCNREGRREIADVYVFTLSDSIGRKVSDERTNLAKGLMRAYKDISVPECIREYYDRLFFIDKEKLSAFAMHRQCGDIAAIPFQTYAEKFSVIDSRTVSVVVEQDEKSRELIENLKNKKYGDSRYLQNYACTIYQKELDDLIRQHVAEDYGTGIYCLTNKDYYDKETGIFFEAKDYYLE